MFVLDPGFLTCSKNFDYEFWDTGYGGGGPWHLVVHVKVNIQTFSFSPQYTLQITHFR